MAQDVLETGREPDDGFDRRSFIKRAAVVGAATVWAAPTVQSLASPAFATGSPMVGECTACITGGGRIDGTAELPVLRDGQPIAFLTFGQGPICCDGTMPRELEINAHLTATGPADDSWHFTNDVEIICTKTGDPAPPPGTAECANRVSGTLTDDSGNTLRFIFEDNGEGQNGSGELVDFVSIDISGPQGTLVGQGLLVKGNLQIHEGLGPTVRDCTGC